MTGWPDEEPELDELDPDLLDQGCGRCGQDGHLAHECPHVSPHHIDPERIGYPERRGRRRPRG